MKIRNSFVLLSAALLAGCATTGQEVAAGYTQALEIERGCMQASKFNETPLCYKQQSELIGQLPPHKNQFAFIDHAHLNAIHPFKVANEGKLILMRGQLTYQF